MIPTSTKCAFSKPQWTKLGYKVFINKKVTITKNSINIYDGHFDISTNLFWNKFKPSKTPKNMSPHPYMPPPNTTLPQVFVNYVHIISSKKALTTFYHWVLCFPTKTSLIKILKTFWNMAGSWHWNYHKTSWPNLQHNTEPFEIHQTGCPIYKPIRHVWILYHTKS